MPRFIKIDNRNTEQDLVYINLLTIHVKLYHYMKPTKMQWVLTVLPRLKIRFTLRLPYLSPHPKNLIYDIPRSVKSYHYPR